MGDMRIAYKIWVGNRMEGPPTRPKRRREDIKIDLMEIRWEGVNWIQLAQDKNQWWVL
jgi:hypothetical protein